MDELLLEPGTRFLLTHGPSRTSAACGVLGVRSGRVEFDSGSEIEGSLRFLQDSSDSGLQVKWELQHVDQEVEKLAVRILTTAEVWGTGTGAPDDFNPTGVAPDPSCHAPPEIGDESDDCPIGQVWRRWGPLNSGGEVISA